MAIHFLLISLALIVLTATGAAMSWDGSFQFFMTVNSQTPYITQSRLVVLPAQGAVLLASRFTENLVLLQAIYGLVYALILGGMLGLSWWIVRDRAPRLYLWAVLGICIGILPGLFPIYSEATLAVIMFWPLALAVLLGVQEQHVGLVTVLSAAIFFTHPTSVLLFILAAGLAFLVGHRHRQDRYRMWIWTLVFVVLAALAAYRFSQSLTIYESEQLSFRVVRETFVLAVAGFPLAALICAWIAAAMAYVTPLIRGPDKQQLVLTLHSAEVIAVTASGALLVVWASDPVNWRYALGFRTWILFCSLPFLGLATLQGIRSNEVSPDSNDGETRYRMRMIQLVSGLFLLILFVQSITWLSVTNRLRQAISQSPSGCIEEASLEWVVGTPLSHPSITTYSLLLQDRQPDKIVLTNKACVDADLKAGFPVGNWDMIDWQGGWFEFDELADSVAPLEQEQ